MAIPTRYTNSTRSVEPWTTTPVSGSTFSRSIRYLGLGTEAPEIQVFVAFLAHSGAPNVGDGTEMRDNYRVYAEKMKERRAGPWIGDRCGASSLSCCGSCGAARLPVADGGADLELHKDDQKLIRQNTGRHGWSSCLKCVSCGVRSQPNMPTERSWSHRVPSPSKRDAGPKERVSHLL